MLWLLALVIAGGGLGTALVVATTGEGGMPERPNEWPLLISTLIFVIGTALPITIHWRLMHASWRGGVVQPQGYVLANAVLYGGYTLTVVVLSAITILRPAAWAFELMAAIPPMLLLLLAWPNGRVMYHHTTRSEEGSEDTLHMQDEDDDQM